MNYGKERLLSKYHYQHIRAGMDDYDSLYLLKMNNLILTFLAGMFSNIGISAIWLLQINGATADPISLLIAAVTGLAAGIVTIFFIYRKEVKERNRTNEAHADKIEDIYEKVVKETNTNISNNNRLTNENSVQIKELRETIKSLPHELRQVLKDK